MEWALPMVCTEEIFENKPSARRMEKLKTAKGKARRGGSGKEPSRRGEAGMALSGHITGSPRSHASLGCLNLVLDKAGLLEDG